MPRPLARAAVLMALGCLGAAAPLAAQGQPQQPPCTRPAYRQFDFWIGEWEVKGPDGKFAGTSSVTSAFGGCVLREVYTGAPPYRGESLNIFDSRTRRWHQTWVDNSGLLAQFDGALRDGSMVLEGDGADQPDKPFRGRMTFTPLPDGRVRQLWERSYDGGATWSTLFEGYYTRRGK